MCSQEEEESKASRQPQQPWLASKLTEISHNGRDIRIQDQHSHFLATSQSLSICWWVDHYHEAALTGLGKARTVVSLALTRQLNPREMGLLWKLTTPKAEDPPNTPTSWLSHETSASLLCAFSTSSHLILSRSVRRHQQLNFTEGETESQERPGTCSGSVMATLMSA